MRMLRDQAITLAPFFQELEAIAGGPDAELRRQALTLLSRERQATDWPGQEAVLRGLASPHSDERQRSLRHLQEVTLNGREIPVLLKRIKAVQQKFLEDKPVPADEAESRQLYQLKERSLQGQAQLRQHYPAVYCMHCYQFARRFTRSRISYILCPACGRHDRLQMPVAEVIGLAGSGAPSHDPERKLLWLPLWDAAAAQAFPAAITELHLRANPNLSYDWVISAVVSALQERMGRRQRIPVRVSPAVAEQINLNTRHILEEIAQGQPIMPGQQLAQHR
jgi:hypothetical protein